MLREEWAGESMSCSIVSGREVMREKNSRGGKGCLLCWGPAEKNSQRENENPYALGYFN